jgi:hypothetical protein
MVCSREADAGYWQFLRVKYGYTDDQIRTYTFNMAPFLADKSAIQQGFVTSEPYKLEQAGAKLVVHLLADGGYSSYATTIETSWKLVDEKPDLVQRFVNGTIEGWYTYLYGDPAPANALIKKDNPETTDDQIAAQPRDLEEVRHRRLGRRREARDRRDVGRALEALPRHDGGGRPLRPRPRPQAGLHPEVRQRLPSAMPYFLGGLRISGGLALIGAVVAEFVAGTGGAQSGLAYRILESGYTMQIPRMFAALLLITGSGIFIFLALRGAA